MQSQKRKRYTKDTTPSDDIVTLIHLVRQNPALYNYKLQPNQRRRIDVLSGWADIAAQIGNKYSVEECRRKWKNLRDTYHQYRLRKPKLGDSGLSKWRYAKELEFLSTVYQPKLKTLRLPSNHNHHHQIHNDGSGQHQHQHHHQQTSYGSDVGNLMQSVVVMPESIHAGDDDPEEHDVEEMDSGGTDEDDKNSIQVHHSGITLVNDDAETFILTAYEDEDEVGEEEDHHHHHHHMTHMELSAHDDVHDDVNELVKNDNSLERTSLDEDGGCAGAEVDYEEVCLYEEAAAGVGVASGGGSGVAVDCETIIGTRSGGVTPEDTKSFQYIDSSDFCIGSISGAELQPSGSVSSGGGSSSGGKVKLLSSVVVSAAPAIQSSTTTLAAMAPTSNVGDIIIGNVTSSAGTIVQLTSSPSSVSLQPTTAAAAAAAAVAAANCAAAQTQTREELDLFFDFLKKKMSRFSHAEITVIQVEFLNCVLRREAEHSLKNN